MKIGISFDALSDKVKFTEDFQKFLFSIPDLEENIIYIFVDSTMTLIFSMESTENFFSTILYSIKNGIKIEIERRSDRTKYKFNVSTEELTKKYHMNDFILCNTSSIDR